MAMACFSWKARISLFWLLLSTGFHGTVARKEHQATKKGGKAKKQDHPPVRHKHEHLFENYYAPPKNGKKTIPHKTQPETHKFPADWKPGPAGARGRMSNLKAGPTKAHPWLKHFTTEEQVKQFEASIKPGEFGVVGYAKENTRFHEVFNTVAHSLFDDDLFKDGTNIFKCALRLLDDGAHHLKDVDIHITSPEYTDLDTKDHPRHHNGRIYYAGRSAKPQLLQWARHHSYPVLSHKFNPVKYGWPQIKDKGHWKGSVSIFLRDKNSSSPLWPGLEQALRPYFKHNGLRFVTAELSTLDNHTLHRFGGHDESQPMMTMWRNRRRFTLEGEEMLRRPEVVRKFLDDAIADRLKPSWTSERPPAQEVDDQGVVTLTGDNFEKYVFDEKKDVLVWFDHMDKCKYLKENGLAKSHPDPDKCTQAVKAFEELFESEDDEDIKANLTIGKFDDSKNDCIEDTDDVSHPKIIIYPAVPADQKLEKKKVYTGKIDAINIAGWARRASTHLEATKVSRRKPKKSAEL